jgi:hypoxanthine phosphoribosyltransferase
MEPGDLAQTVHRLAGDIDRDHPDGVVLVGVLRASVIFLADLARALTVPCEVDFMAISRFAPDSGRVRITKDLDTDITGRHIVLVEAVVDTGLTLSYLLRQLASRSPASLGVCALVDRTRRRIAPLPGPGGDVPVTGPYLGLAVDDDFILGYGLDFGERYRNLPHISTGDVRELQRDPDAYVSKLYPGPGRVH